MCVPFDLARLAAPQHPLTNFTFSKDTLTKALGLHPSARKKVAAITALLNVSESKRAIPLAGRRGQALFAPLFKRVLIVACHHSCTGSRPRSLVSSCIGGDTKSYGRKLKPSCPVNREPANTPGLRCHRCCVRLPIAAPRMSLSPGRCFCSATPLSMHFDGASARANCLQLWADSYLLLRNCAASDTTQTKFRTYKRHSRR